MSCTADTVKRAGCDQGRAAGYTHGYDSSSERGGRSRQIQNSEADSSRKH